MNKVIYKFSDGTEMTSYPEALKKADEQNLTFEVAFVREELPPDKMNDGIPLGDKRAVRLPKVSSRL